MKDIVFLVFAILLIIVGTLLFMQLISRVKLSRSLSKKESLTQKQIEIYKDNKTQLIIEIMVFVFLVFEIYDCFWKISL